MIDNLCGEKTDNSYGLVSVIMPTYNSEQYISQSIESVLSQSYQNFELIIVDDCSTDNTYSVLQKYLEDKRVFYIKTETNSGTAKARNIAIKQAKGKYLAFLDSDDIWHQDKLSITLNQMEKADIVFCCTDYTVIEEGGKQVTVYSPKKKTYSYKDLLKQNVIGCSTVVINVEKVGKVYMPENAIKREDFACWLDLLKKIDKVTYIHQPLAFYRLRNSSVSSGKFKMIKYQYRVYRKVEKLNLIKSLYYLCCWALRGLVKYK